MIEPAFRTQYLELRNYEISRRDRLMREQKYLLLGKEMPCEIVAWVEKLLLYSFITKWFNTVEFTLFAGQFRNIAIIPCPCE
jgi:hypothetical protein